MLLFVSCFVCMNSFGDEIPLEPRIQENPPTMGGGKAPMARVFASFDENTLFLTFAPSSSCQVTITDSQTNTVVYSGVFSVDSTQTIPLTTLPAGEYELSIYAFGTWWEGEFEIE